MASSNPPKKNTAYTFAICLEDFLSPGTIKTNPTLAAADFEVITDDTSKGQLDTTPSVSPASGDRVKISLSADEMNGDNVMVIWKDQTPTKEWPDGYHEIRTVSATAAYDVNVASIAANAITATAIQDNAVTAAKIATDAIDGDSIKADAVTKIQNGLATAAALSTVDGKLPALVGGRVDASVGAVQTDAMSAGGVSAAAVTKIEAGLATSSALSSVASDVTGIASDVDALPAAIEGTGLTTEQADQLEELHLVHGLDPASPLEVDDAGNTREAGTVSQTVVTVGDVTTVTRV